MKLLSTWLGRSKAPKPAPRIVITNTASAEVVGNMADGSGPLLEHDGKGRLICQGNRYRL